MHNSFDSAALSYDESFTYSNIGILQRKLVHKYLKNEVFLNENLSILELNCGTGEDALWFSNEGHQVLATDYSTEMIKMARKKVDSKNVDFKQMDINNIMELTKNNRKFDLIFSNFGGLNCLNSSQLKSFLKNAKELLKDNGHIVLVIMGKDCVWDNIYLFFKGQWSSIFRRHSKKPVSVNLDGNSVSTYYYNPKDITFLVQNGLKSKRIVPIGFFVPTSYMAPFFRNKNLLLKGLFWSENKVQRWSFLGRFSDHYLIHLKK